MVVAWWGGAGMVLVVAGRGGVVVGRGCGIYILGKSAKAAV